MNKVVSIAIALMFALCLLWSGASQRLEGHELLPAVIAAEPDHPDQTPAPIGAVGSANDRANDRGSQLKLLFERVKKLEALKPMLLPDIEKITDVVTHEHSGTFHLAQHIPEGPFYEVEASRYEGQTMFGIKLQVRPELAVTEAEVLNYEKLWQKEMTAQTAKPTVGTRKIKGYSRFIELHHKISDLRFDFDDHKPCRLCTITICTNTKPGEYPLHTH